ncbi:MAG: MaoC/PaaZ C-terminal domain-containing protein [Hyphomicrobium sp.]
MAHIGETCSKRHLFTADDIRSVATALGDSNPAHHDDAFAANSRFGNLIASAGHSTGVFVSLLAEHFTREHEAYGLEFTYKLKRAVPVDLDAILTWRVAAIEPSHKLGGDILKVVGDVRGDDGRVYIEGSGFLLVKPLANSAGTAQG